jgi:hypothetical protein
MEQTVSYNTTGAAGNNQLSTSWWVQGEMVQPSQDLPGNAKAMFNSF